MGCRISLAQLLNLAEEEEAIASLQKELAKLEQLSYGGYLGISGALRNMKTGPDSSKGWHVC